MNDNWGGPGFSEYQGYMKGSDTANRQRQQELDMQTAAFNMQQQQLATLTKAFSPYLSGKIGFQPEQLASMRSQFLNNNAQTFNQAGQQVRQALGARGEGQGNLPVGGTYAAGIAPLMAAQAGSQSQGLLGLNVQNALQALQNQFNTGNLLSGNAAILTGTQGVAGNAASSALNSYINAKNQGFGSAFMGTLGSALGKGVGGGIGNALGGFPW